MGVMVLFCACMACGASAYNNQDAFGNAGKKIKIRVLHNCHA